MRAKRLADLVSMAFNSLNERLRLAKVDVLAGRSGEDAEELDIDIEINDELKKTIREILKDCDPDLVDMAAKQLAELMGEL